MAKEHKGMQTVPEFLRAAAGIYETRNKLYGDNYKRIGGIFVLLFPNGIELKSADDFNRFAVFVQILGKVTRYAEQFSAGGHEDSLDDNSVYSMMLKELDREAHLREAVENVEAFIKKEQESAKFQVGDRVEQVGFLGHRYKGTIVSIGDTTARIRFDGHEGHAEYYHTVEISTLRFLTAEEK